MMDTTNMRIEPSTEDAGRVRVLVQETGFFRPEEVDVAEELVRERLSRGFASGYQFCLVNAPDGESLSGYACYGQTPCAVGAFDLYWIAVHPQAQGRGLGKKLFDAVAAAATDQGGRILFIETSSREQYASTRRFYEHSGCAVSAVVEDFYDAGEHKIIYCRKLGGVR